MRDQESWRNASESDQGNFKEDAVDAAALSLFDQGVIAATGAFVNAIDSGANLADLRSLGAQVIGAIQSKSQPE